MTTCDHLQRALHDGFAVLPQAVADHVETCASCREQLRQWNEISAAAGLMHREWESPDLWPRIHQSLAEEGEGRPRRILRWFFATTRNKPWLAAGAIAALLALSTSIVCVVLRYSNPPTWRLVQRDPDFDKRLLTDETLREVEKAEAAYVRSIDKLYALAKPRLDNASSPLLVNYREKLAMIDSAISECRADIERNQFNAHLRRELASIYREKEQTLEELLRGN